MLHHKRPPLPKDTVQLFGAASPETRSGSIPAYTSLFVWLFFSGHACSRALTQTWAVESHDNSHIGNVQACDGALSLDSLHEPASLGMLSLVRIIQAVRHFSDSSYWQSWIESCLPVLFRRTAYCNFPRPTQQFVRQHHR